jgi:hypothetical protein
MIQTETRSDAVRVKPLLRAIGVEPSTYRAKTPPGRPGPKPKPLDEALKATVVEYARRYPWWGYKRLTIVLERDGHVVGKKFVRAVFEAEDLFQKPRPTAAELRTHGTLAISRGIVDAACDCLPGEAVYVVLRGVDGGQRASPGASRVAPRPSFAAGSATRQPRRRRAISSSRASG